MTTLLAVLIGVFVGLGIVIPILGSLAICVPKWWRSVVRPHVPEGPRWWNEFEPDGTRWYFFPLRLVIVLVGCPFVLLTMLGMKYWMSVMALIERKCPYTPEDYYMPLDQNREDFVGQPTKVFHGLWDFLIRGA